MTLTNTLLHWYFVICLCLCQWTAGSESDKSWIANSDECWQKPKILCALAGSKSSPHKRIWISEWEILRNSGRLRDPKFGNLRKVFSTKHHIISTDLLVWHSLLTFGAKYKWQWTEKLSMWSRKSFPEAL